MKRARDDKAEKSDSITQLKKLWACGERGAIYVVLILFIIRPAILRFFPSFPLVSDKNLEMTLIAIVLLFIFRQIAERLKASDDQGLKTSSSFLDGLLEVLSEKKYYKNVNVLAHTGMVYADGFLRGSQAQIRNLRVLLRDTRNIDEISLPAENADKKRLQEEGIRAEADWHELKEKELVDNLRIQYYPFDPMMTFMIIDKRIAYFDLMKPQKAYPGSTSKYTHTGYIVTNKTAEGKQLISDLSTLFEQIWKESEESQVNLMQQNVNPNTHGRRLTAIYTRLFNML